MILMANFSVIIIDITNYLGVYKPSISPVNCLHFTLLCKY